MYGTATNYPTNSVVGATCGRPKTHAYHHTKWLHTVVIYVLSFHQERKNQRKCFLLAQAQHSPAGFLQIPLRYRLKCGVDLRDARASLKILRSRRGRRAVHQICGSKVVALAIYLTKSF